MNKFNDVDNNLYKADIVKVFINFNKQIETISKATNKFCTL